MLGLQLWPTVPGQQFYYKINTIIFSQIKNWGKGRFMSLLETNVTWLGHVSSSIWKIMTLFWKNSTSWLKCYLFNLPFARGVHGSCALYAWDLAAMKASYFLHFLFECPTGFALYLTSGLRYRLLLQDRIYCFTLISSQDTMPECLWNFVILCIDDLSFEIEK